MSRMWKNFRRRGAFLYAKTLRLLIDFLLSPFRWLGRSASTITRNLLAWWSSRLWRHFFLGLPALLVALCCITIFIFCKSVSVAQLSQIYGTAGQGAILRKDWKRGMLYLERAVELGRRDNALMFDLALAAEKLQDESRKIAVMKRLAPDTHAVYAPAHLWRATNILSQALINQEQAGQAEKQLKFALSLDPNNANANAFLGDLYFQAGIWPSAVEHLSKARQNGFKYRLMLSKSTAAAGNVNNARSVAEDVLRDALAAIATRPSDLDSRLAAGEAALLLEKFPESVRILEEGLRLKADPQIHKSLALVLIHWSDSLLDQSSQNRPQAFRMLASAIEQNPSELILFDRLLKLLRTDDDTAQDAEAFLQENLVRGNAAGLSHLILGTAAFETGDIQSAGVHLEQAFRLMPSGTIVANNFAWYLLNSSPPDISRARQMIDVVIQKEPHRPEFQDTLGHILFAQKEWQGCVEALERALAALPPDAPRHHALSEAYSQLGLNSVAEHHRRLAQVLLDKASKDVQHPR